MKRILRLCVRVALVVSVVAAAGCGDRNGSDPVLDGSEPSLGGIPDKIDTRSIALPLDAYRASQDQLHQVSRARAILTTRCLKRFGYDIPVPEIPRQVRTRHEGRYGLVDLVHAQRFGYREDPVRRGQRPKEPELPPEAFKIMHGEIGEAAGVAVPEGGCLGEAARLLASPPDERVNWVDRLDRNANKRAENDSRIRAVFEKWSSCMRDLGFSYPNPWRATDDPKWSQGAVASGTEIAVATADVGCKQKVGLVPLWFAVDTAYQRELVEKNQEALNELKAHVEQQARKAAQVLGAKE